MDQPVPARKLFLSPQFVGTSPEQVAHAALETPPESGFTVYVADPLKDAALLSLGVQFQASEHLRSAPKSKASFPNVARHISEPPHSTISGEDVRRKAN